MYVAGLLRREPLIAVWSTDTTPVGPGPAFGVSDPWISDDLPDPATPVTTQSTPSGTSTSTSCRLCEFAPRISSLPVGVRTVSLSAVLTSR